jgi:tetraprenyl-beta-curcumene synthase
LAPAPHRQAAIRALIGFQAAYDYADTLAEQPTTDSIANGRQLHQSLLVALDPAAEHPDYFAYSDVNGDAGYLKTLTDACREAFQTMPSSTVVQRRATGAAQRIATYQSLNHAGKAPHDLHSRWATKETPPGSGLYWWETSAACASSLTALALLSAAATPQLTTTDVLRIEKAYHPWVGALHTMLDSLIDWREDELTGQPSLLACYSSISELEIRMRTLAQRSRRAIATLQSPSRHQALLAAMVSTYLIEPAARSPRARGAGHLVLEEIGDLARPSLSVLRLRKAIRRTYLFR